MLLRFLQLLFGGGVAAAGGYMVWVNRASAQDIRSLSADTIPWLLIAGLLMLVLGMVAVVSALLPGTPSPSKIEREARRLEALREADRFYAERARAADRDWRSGDLPPLAETPVVPPTPAEPVELIASAPAAHAPNAAPAAPQPVPASRWFPAQASLQPIPARASALLDLAPPRYRTAGRPSAATESRRALGGEAPPSERDSPIVLAAASPLEAIRRALAASDLETAERLLAAERTRLTGGDVEDALALAELTGLAGDHAAASGRIGGAKWLWRLSLQRFAAADAMTSPAARAVSERLRLADQ
jgi:hypothetical protein